MHREVTPWWHSAAKLLTGCLGEVAGHWALLATMCPKPQLLEKLHGPNPGEEHTFLLQCPSQILY